MFQRIFKICEIFPKILKILPVDDIGIPYWHLPPAVSK
jgi:hypothetical protein